MAREDEIKLIAYNIWLEEGCCDGHDLDHWIRAEIIWEEQGKQGKKPTPAKATAVKEKPAAAKTAKTTPVKKPVSRKKNAKQPENPETKPGDNVGAA
jgi:hypothetical protein